MIIDVLSFGTAVIIVTGRGAAVCPHPWPAAGIGAFAAARDAAWAAPRDQASASRPWSLSPPCLLNTPVPERLVLPSPNGSAIAAATANGCVLAGCLRNGSAVPQWPLRVRGGARLRHGGTPP